MKLKKLVLGIMFILTIFNTSSFAKERVSLGFIYGASDSVELVSRTKGTINQVAPTCLNLSSKGDLVVTSDLTHHFVDNMHKQGVLVTPFSSNHWSRSKGRAAVNNPINLAEQIAKVVEEYDLDGVNIDIENLTSEDRDAFSEFIRILRTTIPYGKMLTVCVAANPNAQDYGWQGSYDYAKIGEYSNYVFIMAYDEHAQGSPAGSVASIQFAEYAIQYAMEFIPNDKIVLGIPFYGRYWNDETGKGGDAIVIGAVEDVIKKTNGKYEYNEYLEQATAKITVNNAEIPVRINGVDLEDGNYTIWYENSTSIKAKLGLVNKYNLLGAGVWALGQEKVDVWEYFQNYLNANVEELERLEKERLEQERLNNIENNKLQVERQKYEALQITIKEANDKNDQMRKIINNNIHKDVVEEFEDVSQTRVSFERAPHIIEEPQDYVKDITDKAEEDNSKNKLVPKTKRESKIFNKIIRSVKRFHIFRSERVF